MAFDVLIKNGTLVDGTGSPRRAADVGLAGGKIVAVGSLEEAFAARTIDAKGLVVAPGFIDMHSHSDTTMLEDPGGESKAHQGVTTEVTGNCAYSPFPVSKNADYAAIHRMSRAFWKPEWDWTDLDGWAEAQHRTGISLNIAPQVGQGAIRRAVGLNEDRAPTDDEMRDMRSLAAEAMEQGAFALSTGLTIAPSSYATTDELVALVEAISPYEGAFYVSHARLWANEHVKAVEECVEIGRRAGVPAQYSHMAIVDSRNFGDGPSMVGVIDRARAEGLDVTYDMYPYTAAGPELIQLMPGWLQEGGVPSMLQRFRDPQLRQRAREDLEKYGWFRGLPFVWESMVLSEISTDANQGLVGLSIGEVAKQRKADPYDTMLDLMDEEDNRVRIVLHNRTESDIRFFLGHEAAMIGSDGNAISPTGRQSVDQPHPRFYGTYPRVLGRYVREQPSVLSLEAAVRKMTGLPAERLRLKDRGLIAEGLVADLVLFDADTVIDRATFEDPHQYPVGIPYVFVNGTAVVDGGVHTGARPGRVLRRGA